MSHLPIIITFRASHMLRINTASDGDIVIAHLTLPTPDSDWQPYQRIELPKDHAINLATAILEKADATHMLIKKHRP